VNGAPHLIQFVHANENSHTGACRAFRRAGGSIVLNERNDEPTSPTFFHAVLVVGSQVQAVAIKGHLPAARTDVWEADRRIGYRSPGVELKIFEPVTVSEYRLDLRG
jgi:hypothetical protein